MSTSGASDCGRARKWSREEDERLRRAVSKHDSKNWKHVAGELPERTDVQCMHRWQKVLKPGLVKGPWTKEEDGRLIELAQQYGTKKWSLIASKLPGRLGKQCRERWFNHLDPSIKKGPWTSDEDEQILSLHREFGNKWARISKHIVGRTDNAIKNRWNVTLSRLMRDATSKLREEAQHQNKRDEDLYEHAIELMRSDGNLGESGSKKRRGGGDRRGRGRGKDSVPLYHGPATMNEAYSTGPYPLSMTDAVMVQSMPPTVDQIEPATYPAPIQNQNESHPYFRSQAAAAQQQQQQQTQQQQQNQGSAKHEPYHRMDAPLPGTGGRTGVGLFSTQVRTQGVSGSKTQIHSHDTTMGSSRGGRSQFLMTSPRPARTALSVSELNCASVTYDGMMNDLGDELLGDLELVGGPSTGASHPSSSSGILGSSRHGSGRVGDVLVDGLPLGSPQPNNTAGGSFLSSPVVWSDYGFSGNAGSELPPASLSDILATPTPVKAPSTQSSTQMSHTNPPSTLTKEVDSMGTTRSTMPRFTSPMPRTHLAFDTPGSCMTPLSIMSPNTAANQLIGSIGKAGMSAYRSAQRPSSSSDRYNMNGFANFTLSPDQLVSTAVQIGNTPLRTNTNGVEGDGGLDLLLGGMPSASRGSKSGSISFAESPALEALFSLASPAPASMSHGRARGSARRQVHHALQRAATPQRGPTAAAASNTEVQPTAAAPSVNAGSSTSTTTAAGTASSTAAPTSAATSAPPSAPNDVPRRGMPMPAASPNTASAAAVAAAAGNPPNGATFPAAVISIASKLLSAVNRHRSQPDFLKHPDVVSLATQLNQSLNAHGLIRAPHSRAGQTAAGAGRNMQGGMQGRMAAPRRSSVLARLGVSPEEIRRVTTVDNRVDFTSRPAQPSGLASGLGAQPAALVAAPAAAAPAAGQGGTSSPGGLGTSKRQLEFQHRSEFAVPSRPNRPETGVGPAPTSATSTAGPASAAATANSGPTAPLTAGATTRNPRPGSTTPGFGSPSIMKRRVGKHGPRRLPADANGSPEHSRGSLDTLAEAVLRSPILQSPIPVMRFSDTPTSAQAKRKRMTDDFGQADVKRV